MPRGYEIPTAIYSTAAEPEKGKFRRVGIDVAVHALWLAVSWALDEKNKDAERALDKFLLDWPFDFHLCTGAGDEVEAKIVKHIINLPASRERLRDFCGLDTSNLMRIAGAIQELLQKQNAGNTTPFSRNGLQKVRQF